MTKHAALSLLVLFTGCSPAPGPAAPAPITTAPSAAVSPPVIEVAITVDDLPSHGPSFTGIDRLAITDRMLDAFRRHRLPPVYGFVNGKRVDETPAHEAVLRHWIAAGNPLGNHTYSHPSLTAKSVPDYLADLEKGEAILKKLVPDASVWKVFRYPFLFEGETLDKRDAVRAYLKEHGYVIAHVSIDADDWAYNPPYARCTDKGDHASLRALRQSYVEGHVDELRRMRDLTRRLTNREVPQVLLLHIGAADADIMDDLLEAYEREGVRWIDLRTALADPFYAENPNMPARYGAALPYRVATARGVKAPPAVFARGLEERLDRMCR